MAGPLVAQQRMTYQLSHFDSHRLELATRLTPPALAVRTLWPRPRPLSPLQEAGTAALFRLLALRAARST